MNNFALNLALNSVSFGQCSIALLKEIYKKNHQPPLFLIGQPDLTTQKPTQEFVNWLNGNIAKNVRTHSRNNPVFKLWHLNGSLESLSKKQVLLSFYELDSPTQEEVNIVKNNDVVLFSSQETVDTFQNFGCNNVFYVPLGFDKDNFQVKNRSYFNDGRITFLLTGKAEKRKHTEKIIRAWVKKFGNNIKYYLNCAIYNPFLIERRPDGQTVDHNANLFNQILEGKKYFNVSFQGFMPTNEAYNDYLNSGNIVIGMSGGEGWGLPEFQATALGKHAVILNAHAYKGWANQENAVLVSPNGKIEVYDGMFFHKGQQFNQGNVYVYDDEAFIHGCEEAIKRFEANAVNNEGLKLQENFSYEKTWNTIETYLN